MISDDLFKHMTIENQHIDYPVLNPCSITDIKVDRVYDTSFEVGKQWQLTVTLGVKFRSMLGHYEEALKEAKTTMLARLYQHILGDLQEIRQASYSGNPRDVIKICNKIESDILKGRDR